MRCTGVPVEARTCAKNNGVRTCEAISRRFWSFQAGSTLLNSAGTGPSPYQPMPKPSPFVVVAPRRECRLWSINECFGRKSRSSTRIGSPEYAIHRHMPSLSTHMKVTTSKSSLVPNAWSLSRPTTRTVSATRPVS